MFRTKMTGMALAAVVMAAGTAMFLPAPGAAAPGDAALADPLPPQPPINELDRADFTLKRTAYPTANAIPLVKSTMTSIIRTGTYTAEPKGDCAGNIKDKSNPSAWYCFDPDDKSSSKEKDTPDAWVSQGVTSTADANANERWNGLKALVVGWYNDDKGIRITVLNTATGKYQHVLLVNPYYDEAGKPSYKKVDIHIGGIAWYGERLFVVDTYNGLREFNLNNIFDLKESKNGYQDQSDLVGYQQPGSEPNRPAGYYAYGHRYILAQTAMWQHQGNGGKPSEDKLLCTETAGNPRYSFISVDRQSRPHRLIVGEFCEPPPTKLRNGRLVTYAMAGGRPALDRDGRARPEGMYRLPVTQVQGAASDGTYFYLNASNGKSASGTLTQVRPVRGALTSTGSVANPIGPEDMSYTRSSRQLWSVTEYHEPGRMIYSIPARSVR